MAKIDWTFINESGTELNRYIATNVVTGEQITFRLLRNPNVIDFVQGTPLDAEKMNSLKDAINQNYDEFTTLNTKVTNLGKQVETNGKDISSMSTSLGNHNDRISANATNIMNNANNISNNSNNISNLQKSVENLNDTIIEVQEENSVINLGECGDPSSATNSTLNTILTQGIYKFTDAEYTYLMLVYSEGSTYTVQHVYFTDVAKTFLSKYERVSYNNGSSWSVKSYTGVSKDYVDTKANNINFAINDLETYVDGEINLAKEYVEEKTQKYEHNVVLYYYLNNNPNFIEPKDVLINVKILNTNSNEMSIGDFKSYILTLPKKTVSGVTKFIQATGIYYKPLNDAQGNYEYGTIFGVYNAITNTNLGIKTIYGEYDYSYSKLTLMDTVIEI